MLGNSYNSNLKKYNTNINKKNTFINPKVVNFDKNILFIYNINKKDIICLILLIIMKI